MTALDGEQAAPYDGVIMRIGKFQFQPGLAATLAVSLLLPILMSLGFWQLHRADEKYAVRHIREQNAAQPPVDLVSSMVDTNAMLSRNVNVEGIFDLEHQLLLDNHKYRGQPGYYVYTPLRLTHSDLAVLVNRGWVAQGANRGVLPKLAGSADRTRFRGQVGNPPSVGLKLGTLGAGYKGWPKVVQYVDLKWMERQVGYRLLPYTIYQKDGPDFGMVRDWSEINFTRAEMPAEKHVSYAVQWFVMAFALLIIYLVANTRRVVHQNEVRI